MVYKDGIVRLVAETIKSVRRSIFKKAMEMVIKIIRRSILTFDLGLHETSITRKRNSTRLSNKLIGRMKWKNMNRSMNFIR